MPNQYVAKWPYEIVSWLLSLLRERIAPEMQLRNDLTGKWTIAIPGSNRQISLVSDYHTYSTQSSNIGFRTLNLSAPWKGPICQSLPAPGAKLQLNQIVEETANGYSIYFDILGLCYWMLSRLEEIGGTDLDRHDRFPASSSHAYKHNYLNRPIVDEWIMLLRQVVSSTWPNLKLTEQSFSINLSHDVDRPSRYAFCSAPRLLRAIGGDIITYHNYVAAIYGPLIRLSKSNTLHLKDPLNTFDWIMDTSEYYGIASAFYFICGRTNSSMDADYEIEDPVMRNLIREISSRGHEIGLHPSYNTYLNPDELKIEADRLLTLCTEERVKQQRWGGRMHYLRWRHPTTMYGWENAGMDYDSSLGYADEPGFRCGTCFEYSAFDPVSLSSLNLRIRPLIVMESSILSKSCLGLDKDNSLTDIFLKYKNACRAVKGTFTLLWHNSELRQPKAKEIYRTVLSD